MTVYVADSSQDRPAKNCIYIEESGYLYLENCLRLVVEDGRCYICNAFRFDPGGHGGCESPERRY